MWGPSARGPLVVGTVPSGTTLWSWAVALQDHVTVAPTSTVREEGLNALLTTLIVVVGGGGAVAVALNVRGEPVRPIAWLLW